MKESEIKVKKKREGEEELVDELWVKCVCAYQCGNVTQKVRIKAEEKTVSGQENDSDSQRANLQNH